MILWWNSLKFLFETWNLNLPLWHFTSDVFIPRLDCCLCLKKLDHQLHWECLRKAHITSTHTHWEMLWRMHYYVYFLNIIYYYYHGISLRSFLYDYVFCLVYILHTAWLIYWFSAQNQEPNILLNIFQVSEVRNNRRLDIL